MLQPQEMVSAEEYMRVNLKQSMSDKVGSPISHVGSGESVFLGLPTGLCIVERFASH